MAIQPSKPSPYYPQHFGCDVAAGILPGNTIVHKFGTNLSVGTSFVPVSIGGVYPTPQVSGATTLRVKAGGNANDDAAGSGAREITIEGIDATGALISESVATAGASASSATSASFLRVFRAYVSASGTYATATAGSHSAAITIENGAGGTDWCTIDATGFPKSQSEIGVYTVPLGYTGYIWSADIFTDSSKTTDVLLFKRDSILETSAPYEGMRVQYEVSLKGGQSHIEWDNPLKFDALTDVGFMAKVDTGTAKVVTEFELMLVEN